MIIDLNSLNFGYGLQTVIAVSVLIALILLVRKHVARQFGAGVAYALWAIPVARLVLPPLSMPSSLVSFFGINAPVLPSRTWTTDVPPAPVRSPEPVGFVTDVVGAPPVPGPAQSSPLLDAAYGPAAFPELSEPLTSGLFLGTLMAVWAGGALYMFARSSLAHHGFMQTLRREELPASPELDALAENVAREIGLKHKPRVSTSLISSGPLVSGLLRPTVLLPAWFEDDYTPTQQRAALAHELTHIKRGDLWALQVSEIFVALLWFNPLAYLARRAFRTDQEAACDSDVLKSGASSPHAYGQTLLKAVQLAVPERLTAAASLPLTHALKERMIRMTTPSPSRSRRLLGAGLSGLLGSAALMSSAFVATACASAEADDKVDMAELAGGEPDRPVPKHRNLQFNDGTLVIDGDTVEDRQVIVLSTPFSGNAMTPALEQEISVLTSKIEAEAAEIESLVASMPAIELSLNGLDDELVRKMELAFSFTKDSMPKTEAEWEAWAEKVEAQAEEWEAHAEAIADRAEAHAEAWEVRIEPKIAHLEARIEAHADELDHKIELAYGDKFERKMAHNHTVLSDLAEQCRDADMEKGEIRILKQSLGDDTDRDVKIVCIKGDKVQLKAKPTIRTVLDSDELDAEDKEAFKRQVLGSSSHSITIETTTSDE